jgi:hypothetical protein
MDGYSSFFSVNKTEYDEEAATVVRLALTGFNKGSIDNLMMQKVVADRIHTLVGDVVPSNSIVSQVSGVLAEHSRRYDIAGKARSDLFVVDANPNILVFDSLPTYSFISVLGRHGNSLPLVVELASAIFLTNGNDKLYHAFCHLEELAMLLKENLTSTLRTGAMLNSEMSSLRKVFSDFVHLPKSLTVCRWQYPTVWWYVTLFFQQMMMVSCSVNPWRY